MTREQAETFVREWIAEWNARDLEAVLARYHEQIVFHSPTAAAIIGAGRVGGKAALRAYWTAALAGLPRLRFQLDHFAWDPDLEELFLVYVATLNDAPARRCERFRFREGLVIDSEGLHGAPL